MFDNDFSFAKIAQAAFCKGARRVPRNFFQNFWAQDHKISKPRGENNSGHPLHLHAFSLPASFCA